MTLIKFLILVCIIIISLILYLKYLTDYNLSIWFTYAMYATSMILIVLTVKLKK
ncbi:hypothetical protein SAMN04488027_11236 [Psychroflexus sediminis]|uniref:Uncharacterized protein n=1 Tax=Psychroflexus sediminis TaxID=470826 RepID=A0A1G7YGD9_9FLAO|nr:hypothetical protein SAMN04488027_11236 [Psychroflexus sediminis]